VNVLLLVAMPPGVVITILPVFAPLGTRRVTFVSELTVKEPTCTPPTVIFVAWISPDPVTVTVLPDGPLLGVKLVILGVTLNILLLKSMPDDVVTETNPVSPDGTMAVK
jgi:hypothetical protein